MVKIKGWALQPKRPRDISYSPANTNCCDKKFSHNASIDNNIFSCIKLMDQINQDTRVLTKTL